MDKVEIESKHAPPLAECAHCEHMLPPGLGEIECEVCGDVCVVFTVRHVWHYLCDMCGNKIIVSNLKYRSIPLRL